MLFEEGRLLLNEPVGKYLPKLAGHARRPSRLRRHAGHDGARRARHDDPGPHAAHQRPRLRRGIDAAPHALSVFFGPASANGRAPSFSSSSGGFRCTTSRARCGSTASASTCSVSRRSGGGQTAARISAERLFAPLGMLDTASSFPKGHGALCEALSHDPLTHEPQTLRDGTTLHKFDCGGGCACRRRRLPALRADAAQRRRARRRAHPRARRSSSWRRDHLGPEVDT